MVEPILNQHFHPGFTPLNILNSCDVTSLPSFRHPWSKSPSHHEILPAPWYLKVHEPRVSRVSDDSTDGRYSVTNNERLLSYCLMLQKSKKKTTTWHVWNSGKKMEYLPYQLVYQSEIVINIWTFHAFKELHENQKILKNAILPSPSISMFWNVSLPWKLLVFSAKSRNFPTENQQKLTSIKAYMCQRKWGKGHVVDVCYAPQKNDIRDVSGWLQKQKYLSWWLKQPIWKICASQNGFIFPKEGWK